MESEAHPTAPQARLSVTYGDQQGPPGAQVAAQQRSLEAFGEQRTSSRRAWPPLRVEGTGEREQGAGHIGVLFPVISFLFPTYMRRNQRLRRPEQFGRVRRDGKTWAHPLLSLNAARNRVGRTRCGFVVGKQIGKAHDRNRAKRRAREAVRRAFPNILPGWDLVFVLRAPVLTAQFDALCGAIQTLLVRAGLWVVVEGDQEASDGTSARAGAHSNVSGSLAPDSA